MIRRLLPVAAGAALLLSGCAGPAGPAPGSSSTTPSHSTSPRPSAAPSKAPTTPGLRRAVDDIAKAHPDSTVTVAVAAVGRQGPVRVVGDPQTLVAWSTIKVPLALAVVRSRSAGDASADLERALTASDNEAAARLWERLGDGASASAAVERQLRRGGDERTRVPDHVTVPGYSPFGQSLWRLSDQTRFTGALPCLSGSASVTDPMGRVVDGQRWGLGAIEGTRFKGGWGSTPDGYVVRQLGLVPGAKGETAVTLQVRTGTHEQGTAIADELVAAIQRHRGELPAGSC